MILMLYIYPFDNKFHLPTKIFEKFSFYVKYCGIHLIHGKYSNIIERKSKTQEKISYKMEKQNLIY